MNVEEEYEGVLQNIESALAQMYVVEPEMTDWQTKKAVDALIRIYQAEQRKRPAPTIKLAGLALASFENTQPIVEELLGRDSDKMVYLGPVMHLNQNVVDIEVMVACLKRIRKSVQMWTKRGGRRGYFEFVRQFLMI